MVVARVGSAIFVLGKKEVEKSGKYRMFYVPYTRLCQKSEKDAS